MWQLVLANISIKGWVIDSNQHSLSDCSSQALVIPAHNAEIVQGHPMYSSSQSTYHTCTCIVLHFESACDP